MERGDATAEAGRPPRNIMLVVAYDGTRYHGFQVQAGGLPTVQGELERALAQITGRPTRVAGAGRTDRGVHALGQVASFHTPSALPPAALQRALNAVLPQDIAVAAAADVPLAFHARFSARSREYRYTILNQPVRSPLERHFAYHVARPLDVQAMDRAARVLLGEHDFASFAGAGDELEHTVRRVLAIGCRREDSRIYLDVAADAFLPHMVRNIVGTLLLVGTGRLGAAAMEDVLAARRRQQAGPTAPPHGLCLVRVNY